MTELPNHPVSDTSLRERVVGTIHAGKAVMRPKWHFVLRAALLVVGGVIVALTLVYVASLALFALRQGGALFVPAFGFRGWLALVVSLPWILLALLVVFVAVLEVLVRHYAFAYRRPLLYSVGSIVALAVLGGIVVERTPMHAKLLRYTSDHNLPVARQVYQEFGAPKFHDIHVGRITSLIPAGFLMENRREEPLTVKITPRTLVPPGTVLLIGDGIVVLGERNKEFIEAFGLRKVQVNMGGMRMMK